MDAMTADRPFGLPDGLITTTVDWPFPPSANRIWRRSPHGGMYLAPKYRAWRMHVGQLVLALRPRPKTINGPFTAHLWLNEACGHGDADNRCKASIDAAQRTGLIANDKFCRRVTIEWTDGANAPAGCRLTLREMVA